MVANTNHTAHLHLVAAKAVSRATDSAWMHGICASGKEFALSCCEQKNKQTTPLPPKKKPKRKT